MAKTDSRLAEGRKSSTLEPITDFVNDRIRIGLDGYRDGLLSTWRLESIELALKEGRVEEMVSTALESLRDELDASFEMNEEQFPKTLPQNIPMCCPERRAGEHRRIACPVTCEEHRSKISEPGETVLLGQRLPSRHLPNVLWGVILIGINE